MPRLRAEVCWCNWPARRRDESAGAPSAAILETLRSCAQPSSPAEQNVCVGVEPVQFNHALGVRKEHLGDPTLHRLLRAPMVVAARDVHACSSGRSSVGWKRASRPALEDQLQWKEIATQRSCDANCDLTLILSVDDRHITAARHFVRP